MTFASTLTKVKWTPEPFQVGLVRITPHTETDVSAFAKVGLQRVAEWGS